MDCMGTTTAFGITGWLSPSPDGEVPEPSTIVIGSLLGLGLLEKEAFEEAARLTHTARRGEA